MALKVSIIVPTYKRPELLSKCLNSLISQNFPKDEYEIIIVTDGPDDSSAEIITRLAKKTTFPHLYCVSLPSKKGPAAARNTGWKLARGKLILFTDDDCIADQDWTSNFHNAFEANGESLLALTGKIIVPRPVNPTDFELNTSRLETADFVTANCACSKMTLEKINGFDEAFTMAWREDSDLQFKLLKENIPILKIKKAIIIHPARQAPWGISIKEQKKSMFDALLFKRHPQLFKQKIRTAVLWKYIIMNVLLIAFIITLSRGHKTLAFVYLSCWILLYSLLVAKRLSNTSHSLKHVVEMVTTSIVIPFFSVFWNLYGAFKFKALHL
jgi:glycosyltransferase involved in cell wall biosynthesis